MASEKFDKVDPEKILADERRRNAVDAELARVNAAIDADAARRLRELVPDLRAQVEGQLVAAEDREATATRRADALRAKAGLSDADYPDLSAELDARLGGLEEQVVRLDELASDPDAYGGHQMAQGQPDPAGFFRFQAANARANLEATRHAVAQAKAKGGRRSSSASDTADKK